MEIRKSEKKEPKQKAYIFLILLGIICFITIYFRNEKLENLKFIKSDYRITIGVVTYKAAYKFNSMRVKYIVNGQIYEETDSYNGKYNFEEGDSIDVKYSILKPELMVTELNDEY